MMNPAACTAHMIKYNPVYLFIHQLTDVIKQAGSKQWWNPTNNGFWWSL